MKVETLALLWSLIPILVNSNLLFSALNEFELLSTSLALLGPQLRTVVCLAIGLSAKMCCEFIENQRYPTCEQNSFGRSLSPLSQITRSVACEQALVWVFCARCETRVANAHKTQTRACSQATHSANRSSRKTQWLSLTS